MSSEVIGFLRTSDSAASRRGYRGNQQDVPARSPERVFVVFRRGERRAFICLDIRSDERAGASGEGTVRGRGSTVRSSVSQMAPHLSTPDRPEDPILVVPEIRQPGNLGAILRSAAAFDFRVLAAADLFSRDGRFVKVVRKCAAGALTHHPVETSDHLLADLVSLKEKGWQVIGLDPNPDCPTVFDLPERAALVLGSERELSPEARSVCGSFAHIPMRWMFNSLNVSVAAGIAMAGYRRRYPLRDRADRSTRPR